ncbi:phosphate ABC transporter permease subunit PstC [Synechococcus sp. Cruz-9H2]|uniref:phosphate ABC transporter permease subunit PstC n=1 Tax=unclassified Synechococcus TaxID=2626047 RepID=UPI0037D9CC3F|nr:phosphate ABC transporter permease subunit PstC [Synechococcus sp. Cruz-9H2]MCP9844825.1 phosphate ABC transporter permease subunit PstC [Synechococcus sp. Edmonson 11F2]MCP9856894.1 phosphate ABC transporter permease subunit PstC [Synechococcus sp. Cruz-9C9]MCP9864180.1 phosphate ABC transporter permease subunit PstC [Synechococcus sp. Cruz-7E5]MCP9871502.1 phosphate ABC transporter permease subunit PstC [Synechococcus sp. Cruz-7B9]
MRSRRPQISLWRKPKAQETASGFTQRRRPWKDRLLDHGFRWLTIVLASIVGILVIAILLVVFAGSLPAIVAYGLDFLIRSDWDPSNESYGAFTAIYGTLVSSLLALLVAVPLGVGSAVFITEDILPYSIRRIIGIMVELLAAIPSVILGLWAIFVMEPALRPVLTSVHQRLGWIPLFSTQPIGPGMAPAVIILAVMLLPIITSISRDTLDQVPIELRFAAYGVGSSRWQSIIKIIIPAAISGIAGGVLLALGRAMGETMAVTMIIGNSTNFSPSLLSPGNTISSMLANQFGEATGPQVSALMYAALILMILTLLVNFLAEWVVRRLKLRYH